MPRRSGAFHMSPAMVLAVLGAVYLVRRRWRRGERVEEAA